MQGSSVPVLQLFPTGNELLMVLIISELLGNQPIYLGKIIQIH